MEESRASGAQRSGSRREQQAAETRVLILNAARHLFAKHGYGATSIAQIARDAGVAIPTIYTSVGTKLDLLGSLNEIVARDAGVDDLIPRLMAEQDPFEVIALQVQLSRRLNENAGDILRAMETAATAEPKMAGPYQAGIQRHRAGMRSTVNLLLKLGALRDGLDVDRASALMDLLLAPSSWRTLTEGQGLSFAAADALLYDTLCRALIGQPRSPQKE